MYIKDRKKISPGVIRRSPGGRSAAQKRFGVVRASAAALTFKLSSALRPPRFLGVLHVSDWEQYEKMEKIVNTTTEKIFPDF